MPKLLVTIITTVSLLLFEPKRINKNNFSICHEMRQKKGDSKHVTKTIAHRVFRKQTKNNSGGNKKFVVSSSMFFGVCFR